MTHAQCALHVSRVKRGKNLNSKKTYPSVNAKRSIKELKTFYELHFGKITFSLLKTKLHLLMLLSRFCVFFLKLVYIFLEPIKKNCICHAMIVSRKCEQPRAFYNVFSQTAVFSLVNMIFLISFRYSF